MAASTELVDLGFVEARVPLGSHICQVYSNESERDDALLRFLARGLALGEATACFSEAFVAGDQAEWFAAAGISLETERESGAFTSSGAESVYFQDGYFDPERMLTLLAKFHQDALAAHRKGARVIGEMSPNINRIKGGSRLLEYEGRVNALLREHPVTAVCQYDARRFDGATIMDVLSVHPLMVVHGNVIQNPFFVAPDQLTQPQSID
jgi:hypothetical protein